MWFETLEKEEVVDNLVEKGKPQAISNTIWSMATLGVKNKVLVKRLGEPKVVEKMVGTER